MTQASEMLQRITSAVEAIRDMNRQIATAAEEQTSVAEDISRNLTEVTAIASTSQANVKRTQAARICKHLPYSSATSPNASAPDGRPPLLFERGAIRSNLLFAPLHGS